MPLCREPTLLCHQGNICLLHLDWHETMSELLYVPLTAEDKVTIENTSSVNHNVWKEKVNRRKESNLRSEQIHPCRPTRLALKQPTHARYVRRVKNNNNNNKNKNEKRASEQIFEGFRTGVWPELRQNGFLFQVALWMDTMHASCSLFGSAGQHRSLGLMSVCSLHARL